MVFTGKILFGPEPLTIHYSFWRFYIDDSSRHNFWELSSDKFMRRAIVEI
jgi:hypothetical protein